MAPTDLFRLDQPARAGAAPGGNPVDAARQAIEKP